MAVLKASNSLSSYGGLGKQKDFLAAREAFVKVPGVGVGAGGLIPSGFRYRRCRPRGEDAPLAPHPGWVGKSSRQLPVQDPAWASR